MKGMCFLIIGFALIISYQSNPIATILIGGACILIYLFFKSRKNGNSRRGSGLLFRKGSNPVSSPINDLMTLLMVQAILDRGSPQGNPPSNEKTKEVNDIEQLKHEVLALFEED